MFEVLLQMAGLILCGVGWKILRPAGLEPMSTRKVLTSLVYYLMLPALVLSVLWKAELGSSTLWIALIAAAGILAGIGLAFFSCRVCKNSSAQAGAVILAAAFPNATYLGLPILEASFGPWARSVAIQYDLFACTPLLFTVGILIAARLGSSDGQDGTMRNTLWQIPAMWAALLAVTLNLMDVPVPQVLDGLLGMLERGVVPLMLFSLGLSLEWNKTLWRMLPSLMPVVILSLFVIPWFALVLSNAVGLSGDLRAAVVMEAAMPSMVIGIVLCDRFNLDVALYAAAVTVTTALSLISLPMWFNWLTA